MKLRLFTFLVAVLIVHGAASQQNIETALQKLLSKVEYRNATAGIHIIDLISGEELFGYNSEKLMIPASTMKLVTSAAALEILGPDYRFQTQIGYTGNIHDGTLKGDLIIVGGGDPALGSEYFINHYFHPHFLDTWAEKIKAAGINRVEGNLVFDLSFYDTEKIPPTLTWEDMGNYYGAGTSALTVYDNLFRITFRSPRKPNQPTEIIAVYPKVEGIELKNQVLSSNINRDRAYVFGSPLDGKRVIRGTIPQNRRAFTIKASNPFPGHLLAKDFLHYLNAAGVFTTGNIVFEKVTQDDFNAVYLQESPELAEIVQQLNVESVNLFAEHLVKQIAAEMEGTGNREKGLQIINDFYHKIGADTLQVVMEDGSGLSHFNLTTPAFLTNLLNHMKNSGAFINSLPSAGEGTLYYFSGKDFPGNTLKAKSGSMTRVRCYAGYLTTDSGKQVAFAFMVNHFSGEHIKLIVEIENFLAVLKATY